MNLSKQMSDEIMAREVVRKVTTELARRKSLEFMHYTKHDFEQSHHHVLLSELVDKLIHEENKRIIVSLPPRHTKSEFFSIRLPAMYLGSHPDRQILHVSYASSLSNKFSLQVRALVRDDMRYRKLFPRTRLHQDRQRLDDWETSLGGGFKSTGMGGGISGHGFNLGIIDDPVKEGDENSPTTLKQHLEWYASAFRTRVAPGANIVLVMTRWHTRDLAGELESLARREPETADQWEIINLPAIAIDDDDPLGREPGQALWEGRFPVSALEPIRIMTKKYWWSLYQQRPLDELGKLFNKDDFKRVPVTENGYQNQGVWCFDLALSKDETADYSAISRVLYDKEASTLTFRNIHHLHDNWVQVKQIIKDIIVTAPAQDKFAFPKHLLELVALQDLRHELPDYANRFIEVSQAGDKHERASVLASWLAVGRVFVEQSQAGDMFINEHDQFPDEHDDFVDMSSVATHHFGLKEELRILLGYTEEEAKRRELFEREQRLQKERQFLDNLGAM